MKFKWKREQSGHILSAEYNNREYTAHIYKYGHISGYGLAVARSFGGNHCASITEGMWHDNGLKNHTIKTIKAAKIRAGQFAKQLSKLEYI